ncbi:MAG: TraK family protein [Janthinobacterium lividum]
MYRGAGRVVFLARLDDFRKLIDAGHPLRAIYDDYAEQLGIGYPQFTRYVGR